MEVVRWYKLWMIFISFLLLPIHVYFKMKSVLCFRFFENVYLQGFCIDIISLCYFRRLLLHLTERKVCTIVEFQGTWCYYGFSWVFLIKKSMHWKRLFPVWLFYSKCLLQHTLAFVKPYCPAAKHSTPPSNLWMILFSCNERVWHTIKDRQQ